MSLGPVGTVGPAAEDTFDQFELIEETETAPGYCGEITTPVSPGEEVSLVEFVESPVDPAEQKRIERQQILTDQVITWLKSKDPHKFWRQFLAGACNRNLSYNTWPSEMQSVFNERFESIVSDQEVITTICGRISKMQNGHLVACHVAGAFIVVLAGFLSFSLMEV